MKSQLPLRSAIIEILRKKDGVMLDSDLPIALKSRYGRTVIFSDAEINRALMTLETQGLIHVQLITKNKRRIKRLDKEMTYLGVEED
ncbi:MAG: hypothetical protein HeimC2_24820 [Candidatus Heimdallarchaeota archaeon LC_2]|nr:MAG: hypothetical protein HeimC2_24820 [Candidatus Heimdallarchaeota archaeon LC_2]